MPDGPTGQHPKRARLAAAGAAGPQDRACRWGQPAVCRTEAGANSRLQAAPAMGLGCKLASLKPSCMPQHVLAHAVQVLAHATAMPQHGTGWHGTAQQGAYIMAQHSPPRRGRGVRKHCKLSWRRAEGPVRRPRTAAGSAGRREGGNVERHSERLSFWAANKLVHLVVQTP